jgi:ABC-type siderophore export system fused ATPase/permease subunit
MKEVLRMRARAGERGAVSIKAVLTLLALSTAAFVVIKIVPIYVEQRQVIHQVEELARISAVRGFKVERINQDIEKIRGDYDLPENSITLGPAQKGVRIIIGYSKNIDFLVTNYIWRVEHTAVGREL